MTSSSRSLQAAALGITLLSVLGGCRRLDTLVFSTVTMGLGALPDIVARALAMLDAFVAALRSAGGVGCNELVDAAREAFVCALHAGFGLAAALAMAAAVGTQRLLRRAGEAPQPGGAPAPGVTG